MDGKESLLGGHSLIPDESHQEMVRRTSSRTPAAQRSVQFVL